jgi:hypothetical protein
LLSAIGAFYARSVTGSVAIAEISAGQISDACFDAKRFSISALAVSGAALLKSLVMLDAMIELLQTARLKAEAVFVPRSA